MKTDRQALSNGNQSKRRSWKFANAAKKFHAAHGFPSYTMYFNETLEAEMRDKTLPKEARILAAIRLMAWGNLSDWAVDALPALKDMDPAPQPITQDLLAQLLGMAKSTISEAIGYLKENGYIKKDHPFLFPIVLPNPLKSTKDFGVSSDSTNIHSPFLRFQSFYFQTNSDLGKTLSHLEGERKKFQGMAREASTEIRRINQVVLSAYRDFERNNPDVEEGLQRLCVNAQYEGEDKANKDSMWNLESSSDSNSKQFATPPAETSETRTSTPPNPQKTRGRPPRSSTSLNLKGIDRTTTTLSTEHQASSSFPDPAPATQPQPDPNAVDRPSTVPASPASPSISGDAAEPPQEWRQRLVQTFDDAGKGVLLPEQIRDTYRAANGHADGFLQWLGSQVYPDPISGRPITGPLHRTKHGGGLPRLLQFYEAELAKQPRVPPPAPMPEPQAAPKWENQGSWEADREHWNELAAEDQELYRALFPEEAPAK